MAATPYTATLTFKGKSGADYVLPISGNDVATNFVTFTKSGVSFWQPPEDCWLTDIALSASGVDTTRIELFLNSNDSGISWLDGSLVKTIPLPRLTTPIGIRAMTMVQLKQQTS